MFTILKTSSKHTNQKTSSAHSNRSEEDTFPSTGSRTRSISARPETEHNISGAPARTLSPRRWGKQKGRLEQSNCIWYFPFSPTASKKFGRAARRVPSPSGRSMIEMLAVLAIIGVLSITALVGFTYAMNKHRANETIYDVMLRGTNVPMIDEYYYDKTAGYEFRFPGLVNNGRQGTYYPMTTKKDAGSSYYVEATGVTYRVCELILKMNPTDIDQIVVNNSVYQGDSDICGTTDGLAMKFCFGSDGTICDGTGNGGSSGGSGSGSSGGSGSGSGSGEIGTTCDPACGICEQCVDGSCEVRPCSISSCPDTQQPTGTDECGCIIGCEDKCPDLSCGTCEVPNYETCSCDVDSSCTCEERGGETIYYLTGVCCEQPSSCCSLDNTCVQEECTITDSTQCGVLCEEGAQTTSVCCTAVSIDGDDPMNHVWVGDRYGEGYCCASKSESQACCEADSGKWCDGICCGGTQTCGNAGKCCEAIDVSTCTNGTTTDTNGCEVCAEECTTNERGYDGRCCLSTEELDCEDWEVTLYWGCTVCIKDISCQDYLSECEYMCANGLLYDCISGTCTMTLGEGYNDPSCGGTGYSCSIDYQTNEGEAMGQPLAGNHFQGGSC